MRKQLAILVFALVSTISFANNSEIDSLLQQLDATLKDYRTYMDAKELRISSLKNLLKSPSLPNEQAYNLGSQLYQEYRIYNVDSALEYLKHNLEVSETLHKPEWINETKFNMARIFAASGMYNESLDMLESVNKKQLLSNQKSAYFSCYEYLYNELSRYTRLNIIASKYKSLSKQYRDSLFTSLDKASDDYLRAEEIILLEEGKTSECKKYISILLSKAQKNTPDYAYLNYRMAMAYNHDNNIVFYKKYLIISAMSDIKAAVKDNTSLTLLASQLYSEKDIDRAYNYIKFALEDANFFNARLRLVQVSNILPVINQAYQTKSENQKSKLRQYLWVISILSLFLILAILFIYKQMRNLAIARNDLQVANNQLNTLNADLHNVNNQLKELNLELSETNTIKEQYIGLFLSICSTYIDKLENYRRMTNKFITSGKVSELYETTKSRQLIDNELKEFYDNFDNTFLHIFPNFVDELNSLLVEDERIILKKGELLNTELRIFALIRLGITDSSKIAGLLRYSVNTIYNYRVKIKNKSSVPREDFENMIMKIGTFSK